jgi:hypothetical protein
MFLMSCREFIVSHEQNQFYILLFPYVLCWALPLQGQGISHWIQLLEVLPC